MSGLGGRVNLVEIEHAMARLDAVYRPVATEPVDDTNPDWFKNLGPTIRRDLARLGVEDEAQAVLRAIIEMYAAGDEPVRAAIRQLLHRYPSFAWAAPLPLEWDTAEEFRAHLIRLSACDHDRDTRDEILTLQDMCDRARRLGIDVDPIVEEVAAMSSDVDRYGMRSGG
jgi:hypothetical protein